MRGPGLHPQPPAAVVVAVVVVVVVVVVVILICWFLLLMNGGTELLTDDFGYKRKLKIKLPTPNGVVSTSSPPPHPILLLPSDRW